MRALRGRLVAGAAAIGVITMGGLFGAVAQAKPEAAPAPVVAPASPTYEVGKSYLGANGYIEYFPGNAPVILTAPHGGALKPDSIPDRTRDACGGSAVTVTDTNTAQLVMAMRESYHARFGTWPHVIVSNISRRKLDANRPLAEAACGNAEAEKAFGEWHAFIDAAKDQVVKTSGRGWYMDIHGHGHEIQRLELGYLLKPAELEATDTELDASPTAKDRVSIQALLRGDASLSRMLRGPNSLGSLYARNGFPSIPSRSDPAPMGARYFNGGYNTSRHTCNVEAERLGSKTGGAICGIQIESNYKGVRDTVKSRKRFGDATAIVLEQYLAENMGLRLKDRPAK